MQKHLQQRRTYGGQSFESSSASMNLTSPSPKKRYEDESQRQRVHFEQEMRSISTKHSNELDRFREEESLKRHALARRYASEGDELESRLEARKADDMSRAEDEI